MGLLNRVRSRTEVELVSGRCRRMIEEHCAGFFHEASGVEVHRTVSLWGTSEPVTWNAIRNPFGAGVAVNRATFDAALLHAARVGGATILCPANVLSIERRNGSWRVHFRRRGDFEEVRAGRLILAAGLVGRRFVSQTTPGETSQIALMTTGNARDEPDGALYLERVENGWWYALPRIGGYFVGFCTKASLIRRRPATLRDFFVAELARTRLLTGFLSGHSLDLPIAGRSVGARGPGEVAGDGWIAVGDAAYAPDPLSGMGIEFAIESGRRAAVQLQTGDRFGSSEYAAWSNAYAGQSDEVRAFYL